MLLTPLTLHAAPRADREKRNNIFRAGHVVGFNKKYMHSKLTYSCMAGAVLASGRTAEERNYIVLKNIDSVLIT